MTDERGGAGRWRDWSSLTVAERAARLDECRRLARGLQDRLGTFVHLEADAPPPAAGALAGLPYAAKDMMATAARRPGCGLAAAPDLGAATEASVLRLLDRAGACRIGFAGMTALAYEPSGAGIARNPWNRDFAPGGSSSGPAVAVASGAAVIALGSDTGGSVRIPAQACGITGWKPTPGLVPTDGTMPLSPSLDTIGLLAGSAAEIAPAAAVLTGGRVTVPDGQKRPVIAVAEDALAASEEPIGRACRIALDVLGDGAAPGPRVDALDIVRRAGDEALLVMQAEAWRTWAAAIERGECDAVLAKRLAKGREIDDGRLAASLAGRGELRALAESRLLGHADLLALPVMPIRTPPLSEVDPASPDFVPRTLYALSAFTRFANYLGLPAVAVPVGFDDRGLPVGLQLVGRPGSDGLLLAVARRFQAATDWHGRIPGGIADAVADILRR